MVHWTYRTVAHIFLAPKVSYGLFAVGLALMAIASYAAVEMGQSLRESVSASRHYTIGEVASIQRVSLTVESVRYDAQGDGYIAPKPGRQFLMPTIYVKNGLPTNFELIPLLYFYLKDGKGNVYNTTVGPIHGNQLAGPILPYEGVREEIAFDVPNDIVYPSLYFERGTADHAVGAIDLWDR